MNEKEFLDILKGNKVIAKENRKETLDDIRQSLDALIESKFPNSQNLLHILYENLNANNMDIYRVIFSGLKEKDFTKFLLPDNKGNTPLLVFAKICQGRGGNDMYLKLRNFLFKQLECDVGEIKNIKGESPNGLMREKAIQNPTDEILTDITAELGYLAVNKGYGSPRAAGFTGAVGLTGAAKLIKLEGSSGGMET